MSRSYKGSSSFLTVFVVMSLLFVRVHYFNYMIYLLTLAGYDPIIFLFDFVLSWYRVGFLYPQEQSNWQINRQTDK